MGEDTVQIISVNVRQTNIRERIIISSVICTNSYPFWYFYFMIS